MNRVMVGDAVPLVVDVDGTLIRTDLLHEAALGFVAAHPFQMWRLAAWLGKGKAVLKAELAMRVPIDVAHLPLREEVVALMRAAVAEGRPVYLASASHHSYVEALATRLGDIAGVFATEGDNVAGSAKAGRLVEAFGEGRFDYVGDAPVDRPVWRVARRVLLVSHRPSFERSVRAAFPDATVVARERPRLRAVAKAVRPHQWAKNGLVFLPLLIGHYFTAPAIVAALLAFLCFSLAASSVYLANDLLDIEGDRRHHRKRFRPIAAGTLPVVRAIVLAFALLIAAAAISLAALPIRFTAFLAIYLATTLAYSLVLKRKVLIDVIVLGGLYTLRVLGGVEAIEAARSPWLLMFSLFLFTALALVKRCSELIAIEAVGERDVRGRGYGVADLRILLPSAAAAGFGAVFVAALYLSAPEVVLHYNHPLRLWLICPIILYWIVRVLILCNRGQLHDDPVVFALRDRVSWACGACVLAIMLASI